MTQRLIYQRVRIAGFGYELPPHVIASEDLEAALGPLYRALHLKPGQLEALTGITERRWWDPGYPMHAGAAKAGRKALAATGIDGADLGMLIYAGVCRDHIEPATACAVADALGLGPEAQVYDVSNACLGVLNGMVQIADAIELGRIRAGMVVSCETARAIVELTLQRLNQTPTMENFKHCVATLTGGSGAVAVVLTDGSIGPAGHRLAGGVVRNAVAHHGLCRWGTDTDNPAQGIMRMDTDAPGVLAHGVALGRDTYREFVNAIHWPGGRPDRIVCHQVGAAHRATVLQAIGIPLEDDFSTFAFLGNIGTVSLPITAAIGAERGFLAPGQRVGFFGIGSGLNCILMGLEW